MLSGDEGYIKLLARLKEAELAGNHAEVLTCHEEMIQTAGYSKPAQAATIMSGLGFRNNQRQAFLNSFSGGWRMRLSLARCLMKPCDLLLLDEPTNHLDLGMRSAIELALQYYEGALILISHDRHMLRTTVDDFFLVHQQKVQVFNSLVEDYYLWLLKYS